MPWELIPITEGREWVAFFMNTSLRRSVVWDAPKSSLSPLRSTRGQLHSTLRWASRSFPEMRKSMGWQSPPTMTDETVLALCFGAVWKENPKEERHDCSFQ